MNRIERMQNAINWAARAGSATVGPCKAYFIDAVRDELKQLDSGATLIDPKADTPEARRLHADALAFLAECNGACLGWQMPKHLSAKMGAAIESGIVRMNDMDDCCVHPDAIQDRDGSYSMPSAPVVEVVERDPNVGDVIDKLPHLAGIEWHGDILTLEQESVCGYAIIGILTAGNALVGLMHEPDDIAAVKQSLERSANVILFG